jgi:hypothetical protein
VKNDDHDDDHKNELHSKHDDEDETFEKALVSK